MCNQSKFETKKLTIVIPTNRPYFLRRLIEFIVKNKDYEDFCFIVADSGENSDYDLFNGGIFRYKKYPSDCNPYYKMKDILRCVSTPYMMFIGDDDFYVKDTMLKLLSYDADVMCGRTLSFLKKDENIVLHLNKKYHSSFISIVKTEKMQDAFNFVNHKNTNVENETLVKAYLNQFDSVMLNDIYLLREKHDLQTSNIDLPSKQNIIGDICENIKSNFDIEMQLDFYKIKGKEREDIIKILNGI